ncbi:hypothetical protein [Aneurinibacillus aneurinilyticus]|nr:hypothetical protein [Aneurinibacillus aneurinilyticus]MCI1694116.1 hypothetical protein [Aneurinibacillus aneurinilyticus]MED0672422.1 hypothetical protein [Aneurinibacillus aneurinilyticus]MED0708140.1 hypothetical protein [Aneurinibacillus aneurinilyticus]MED0721507.1 hypothetical protein [Aneurinibacillus aneurinilyticus]MED0734025.1 hypothetical protein [Aneurinibacillus aneurinilyticus]
MRKKGSYLFGMGMVGIGSVMMLGILNLGFLIPLFIAGLFIYVGWNIIKRAQGERPTQPPSNPFHDMMPHHPFETKTTHHADEIDLWEKEMNQGGTSR